jgi:hypothetical protein
MKPYVTTPGATTMKPYVTTPGATTVKPYVTTPGATTMKPYVTTPGATTFTPYVTTPGATTMKPYVTTPGATTIKPYVTTPGATTVKPYVTTPGATTMKPYVTTPGATTMKPYVTTPGATTMKPYVTTPGATTIKPYVTTPGATTFTPYVTTPRATTIKPYVTTPGATTMKPYVTTPGATTMKPYVTTPRSTTPPYFSTTSLNIIYWFNPETLTGTKVTNWNDSISNYNLTKYKGDIDIIDYNGYKILKTNYSEGSMLKSSSKVSKKLGGVLFGYNLTNLNQQKNSLTGLFGGDSDLGIRTLYNSTGTNEMNTGDLNYQGSSYLNGKLISSGSNSETLKDLPKSLPTTYNIQYVKFSSKNQTFNTVLNLLSYSKDTDDRAFFGHLSDFFIVNNSFTDTNQKVLEGYLAYKLNIQSKLPKDHTYYSATNSKKINIYVG